MLTDLPGILPVSITVSFPQTLDGGPLRKPYAVAVTLASLSLTEFDGATTNDGSKPISSSCVALFTTSGGDTPTNDSELSALAIQIATDWYRWQLSTPTIAFAGSCPWELTGMEDGVEWTWETPEPHTRVFRPTFNDYPPNPTLQSGTGGSISNYYYDVVVENLYITNQLNIYNTQVFVDARTYYVDNSTHINNYFNVWNNPTVVNLVNNVCLISKTAEKAVTGTTSLANNTWVDLTGSSLTFTLDKATVVIVVATFDLDGNNTGSVNDVLVGAINIDGARTNHIGVLTLATAKNRATVVQTAKASLAAGSHTIKLQGRLESGTGPGIANEQSRWVMTSEERIIISYKTAYLPNGTQLSTSFCVDGPTNCCPSPPDPTNGCDEDPCSFCSQESETWSVTLSGFSACGSALDPNGTYSLAKVTSCAWEGTNGAVWLRLTASGFAGTSVIFHLSSITGAAGGYTTDLEYFNFPAVDGATVDCCQSVVLNQTASANTCVGPSSVTIVPVNCGCGGVPDCFCPNIPTVLTLTVVSGCPGAASPVSITYNAAGAFGAGWYGPTETFGGHTNQWFMPCEQPDYPGFLTASQIHDGVETTGSAVDPPTCDPDPFDSNNIQIPSAPPCGADAIIRITEP